MITPVILIDKDISSSCNNVTTANHIRTTIEQICAMSFATPIIVCQSSQKNEVTDELLKLDTHAVILIAPTHQGSAAMLASAALTALTKHRKTTLMVFSAAQLISNLDALEHSLFLAARFAKSNYLALIDNPTYTNNGEHPSDIYAIDADLLLDTIELNQPKLLSLCQQAMIQKTTNRSVINLNAQCFTACPIMSIEFAALSKVTKHIDIPLKTRWSSFLSQQPYQQLNRQTMSFIGDNSQEK